MSHDQHIDPDYSGPVPAERRLPPRSHPSTPPPQMPSSMLDPLDGDPSELPASAAEPVDSDEVVVIDDANEDTPRRLLLTGAKRKHQGRLLVKRDGGGKPGSDAARHPASAEQRLLVLDTWKRSGLPAGDFAPLVGVSKHTLYAWKARFEEDGPAGLMDRPRGSAKGSRLPELTKRAILMMKEDHPDWGVDRISDLLLRTQALAASPASVAKVLHEDGYQCVDHGQRVHRDRIRFFERAAPNQLWQTDLFTFVLKRQNQRLYLVAFMDDHSRFIVSYGLHASQSTALVLETFRAGIASYGNPAEVLTDNGSQYITWRGTSQFSAECQKRGIKQIVSRPRHPQTLGKIERFWGTLWRECVESAVFTDLGDARIRIGHFIDHYNFQRTHSGIGGMVPADRFFSAAPAVLKTLSERVAANALEISRSGVPKAPLYLTGNVDGQPFAVHAQGDRVILTAGASRTEIDFDPRREQPVPPPAAPLGDGSGASSGPTEVPLPQPVSPVGVVASGWTPAEELPPGVSAIDDLGLDEAASPDAGGMP
jgi:transposase InsO family protein